MINDLWYKNAVIYCLSVGTYMDSNGDGIGDFTGLMRRLDYLHGLGVTAIWLMPFQVSPHRDDGYDVSDYYGVDPRYGTMGDFVEFTHGAKQRGIRVLIDLDRKSTRLNSSHVKSSYAVFRLKKKKRPRRPPPGRRRARPAPPRSGGSAGSGGSPAGSRPRSLDPRRRGRRRGIRCTAARSGRP